MKSVSIKVMLRSRVLAYSVLFGTTLSAAAACSGDDGSNGSGDGDDHGASGGTGQPEGGAPGGDGDQAGGGDGTGGMAVIPDAPPNWEVTGVATWRGNAKGAYTIFHDDTCNPGLNNQLEQADPALTSRGLVASFGAIAGLCVDNDAWDDLERLRSHGHEIANHSFSHVDLREVNENPGDFPDTNIAQEIDIAHETFSDNLVDFEATFFIFPFDSFNDATVEHLRDRGYLGARAGVRDLNNANFPDDLRINFDAYGPGYSKYAGAESSPCSTLSGGESWDEVSKECRIFVMNQYVDDIINEGGYGIRELHSLDGEGWETIPFEEYEAHLNYLVAKVDSGDLWVATASDAIRYRRGREVCAQPKVAGDILDFSDLGTECLRFATTLSYEISSLGTAATGLSATQGTTSLTVVELGGGSFRVDADPSGGPVFLTAE